MTETAYDETMRELRVLFAEPPKLRKGALPYAIGAMLDQPDFCRQLLEVIEAARLRGVSPVSSSWPMPRSRTSFVP
jgi:hypothetical protein